MDLELAGKRALVTGSSRGIGRAIAGALRAEGCEVVLNGREPLRLAEAAAALGCDSLAADVTDAADCARLFETVEQRYGRLDVLVCNVGSGRSLPPGREDGAEWLRMLNLNLMAAVNAIQAARPLMARTGGAMLCVSSICGQAALGAPLAYSAAKAALDSYVRGAARVLAADGIRLNALAPGNVLFSGSVWEGKLAQDEAAVRQMLEREVALARLGSDREIADTAAFLCSARASFTTGSVVVVDGGQLRA
ncbi:SDR family NAD(P)-dependent oxidoreductase [Chromobacterium sphagni]|uniref:Oxidoreductase n=1 Tax=Chromobacterium sphagni TaxID=1903179 RepID=A0A1S1WZV0_9NEIS|nr:SDR family oxidoreductase [Chromobacterium sphagni]OHX12811.1 oxidoreductase [Chromobacterium sphagni]OHX17675.1 oxidoreductase [Chromobacterium sphagni]